ncbi:MAG: lycopene cyclase domain-containing protein [Candidatus Kryptonium sp.]
MKTAYLLVDLLSVIIPFIAGFHPKINLYKTFPFIILGNIIVMVPFIIWDHIFVNLGIWGFNEKYILGYKIFNLPIEEYLFFICIPFACIFTHLVIWGKFEKSPKSNLYLLPLGLILFISLVFSIQSETYTKVIGIFTLVSTFIALLLFRSNFAKFMREFIISYFIILVPFVIVNGTLTGSFTPEPIVWYNDSQILGYRFLRIPVEDFLYTFSLIILNIAITYLLLKKNKNIRARFRT